MLTKQNAGAANPGINGIICRIQQFGKMDGAIAGSLILIVVMFFLDAATVLPSFQFAAGTIWTLSPYFIAAFSFSAYLRSSNVDMLLTSVFQGKATAMIFAATFFGAWSPLCSCSVIALIAVLLRAGMPLSAIVAFWISSPIISPGMYVLTGAVLGYEFATAKLVAAIVMGITAGFLTLALENAGRLQNPLRDGSIAKRVAFGQAISPTWAIWRSAESMKIFKQEFITVAVFLTKWMFFAFLLESMLMRYTPASLVADWVGNQNTWAVPLAILIGVPAYINGVAAVPLMATLIGKGMSEPAAMAFLLGGSVTSIPAMSAVFVLVRKRVFFWYVALSLFTAYLAAEIYHLYLVLAR